MNITFILRRKWLWILYSEQIIMMYWLTVMSLQIKYFCNHEGHQSYFLLCVFCLAFFKYKKHELIRHVNILRAFKRILTERGFKRVNVHVLVINEKLSIVIIWYYVRCFLYSTLLYSKLCVYYINMLSIKHYWVVFLFLCLCKTQTFYMYMFLYFDK